MEQIASASAQNDAFISYSRKDRRFAIALQEALQRYKPPRDLRVPQGRLAVFRDETDITGVDYYDSITQHLLRSRKLIVVCSPNARHSEFVNDEIRRFVSNASAGNIIPVLLEGIPNNEAGPTQEAEKAFPDALVDALTLPLAGSFLGIDLKRERVDRGRFQGSWYKLLADLYGVSRSELEQREKKREAHRIRIVISVSSAVSLILAIALAVALVSRHQAIERGKIALSRQLAAQSQLHTGDRLGLASLLAAEAVSVAPTHQAQDQLLRIVQTYGNTERVMSGNLGAIRKMKHSADGAHFAAADDAGHVMVWDRVGRPLALPADSDRAAATAIAVRADASVAVAKPGQGIKIWETAQNKWSASLGGRDGRAIDLAFAREGRWLAVSNLPHEIVWWDLERRQSLPGRPRDPHRALVDLLVASADGRYVVSKDVTGNVVLWDCRGEFPEVVWTFGFQARISSVAFSADGRTLAFAREDPGRSILLWRIGDKDFMVDRAWNVGGHRAVVRSVSVASGGQRMVSVDEDGKAIEWVRGPTGFQIASSQQLPDGRSSEYVVSPDAQEIAMGRSSGELAVLKAAGRFVLFREVAGYDDLGLAPLSVDGVRVAAVRANGTAVVQDIARGHALGSIESAMGSELPFAWSGTGRLGAVDRSGSIHIWDPAVGNRLASLPGSDEPSKFYRISMSRNGARVGTVGDRGSVDIWDIATRRRFKMPSRYRGDARVLSLSPDGDRLATSDETGIVSFWKLGNDRPLGSIDLRPERIVSLTFSPDGALLAVGAAAGRVAILDAENQSRYLDFERVHNGPVFAIAFSRNGDYMASGGANGEVLLWNVRDRTRLGSSLTGQEGQIADLAFSDDGKMLASTNGRSLRLWDVDPSSWQRRACAIANRDLTCAEWREHVGDRSYQPHCGISIEEC